MRYSARLRVLMIDFDPLPGRLARISKLDVAPSWAKGSTEEHMGPGGKPAGERRWWWEALLYRDRRMTLPDCCFQAACAESHSAELRFLLRPGSYSLDRFALPPASPAARNPREARKRRLISARPGSQQRNPLADLACAEVQPERSARTAAPEKKERGVWQGGDCVKCGPRHSVGLALTHRQKQR